ncbi:signal recognition particle-docking protein FtsY [Weissella viridescens]|uniref:Signal recognition particle receptor FtsY n=1 Tax=Weissella viridescens TaxID=1629 RepID=A0A3P2RFM6_WEIVI|nr:signal recognition particle-docking protein FtsY [Weissella viridescens]RRG18051.1 signal recognition particle-docking protein FtsY [Weissella viridescens]
MLAESASLSTSVVSSESQAHAASVSARLSLSVSASQDAAQAINEAELEATAKRDLEHKHAQKLAQDEQDHSQSLSAELSLVASMSQVEAAALAESASFSTSVVASESQAHADSLSESQSLSASASADAASEVNETAVEQTAENDLDQGLSKTRRTWSDRWNHFMSNFRSVDEDFFDDLEETLISADVGAQTAVTLTDELRDEVKLKNAKSQDDVSKVIIQKLIDLYERQGVDEDTSMHMNPNGLTVILFVGVNGVGKTTTIGKMSARYKQEGKHVVLAAADTFRAGATEQLVEWGNRNEIPVVTGAANSDPASVVYDGVKQAQAQNADILFVDTAGRLQNNVNLMQELAKMKRIIQREIPEAPQEVLLVLDATTGQNALQQARLFKDSTDVTGIVLTKLDGTAKGGIILPIRNELHLPVKWIGVGEKVTDLQPFDADAFVKGLFGRLLEGSK